MDIKNGSGSQEIFLSGGAHAVLLIHGLTGSPFEMKYLARKLNKAGFTVYVPCLAGHGSSVKELKATGWQDWYASSLKAFRKLKDGYETVSVSGLCMGALLALRLASEFNEEVNSVSLLSTTLFYDGWSLPWYKFLLPLMYYPPFKYFYSYRESPPYGIKNERLREAYLQWMRSGAVAYDSIPSESMRELNKLSKAAMKSMERVTSPVIILHSAEDDLASSKNADYVEAHVRSGRVKKVLVPDSYHMITIDNQKDFVVKETVEFFKSCMPERRFDLTGRA